MMNKKTYSQGRVKFPIGGSPVQLGSPRALSQNVAGQQIWSSQSRRL